MERIVPTSKADNHDRPEPTIVHQPLQQIFSGTRRKIQQIGPESILESISLGVFTVNKEMDITSFNRAAEVIIGMSRQRAIGKKCSEIFCSSVCGHNCPMRHTLVNHTPRLTIHTFLLTSRGFQIPVMVSTTPLRNQNNEIIGGTATFQDLRLSTEMPQKNPLQLFGNILTSRSEIMGDIIQTLPCIAASRESVLLEGEVGTGKKTLARNIHALSQSSNSPFITFNCANQSGTTLEEKLNDLEQNISENSTLFLNQIHEMNTYLQGCLLNMLERNNCTNNGRCSVRLIAATERSLQSRVQDNRFSPSLYATISTIIVNVPPLRERKEDIPIFINNFTDTLAQLQDRPSQGVSQEALSLLMAYNFPGNIQELRDIIEYAAITCTGSHITPLHLPPLQRGNTLDHSQDCSMEGAVHAVEVQTIISALKRNNYNRKAAAQDLGIHKSTFFRKIKNLGIVLPRFDGRFRLPANTEESSRDALNR